MTRYRTYERLHKRVGLNPDNWNKLQSIKGDQTYDQLFGKIFRKMKLEDIL